MRMLWYRPAYITGGMVLICVLALVILASCGENTNGASVGANPTPTCPPVATNNFKTVSGTIATLQADSMTVTAATGTESKVTLTTNTRVTKLSSVDISTLKVGTTIQVIVQSSSTSGATITPQLVLVQNGNGFGNGNGNGSGTPTSGGNGGFRNGNGTPTSRGNGFNPACRRTTTSNTNGLRGVRGTIVSISADSKQISVRDQQNTMYSFTIGTSTVVATTVQGARSDLAVGDTVTITGQQNNSTIQAISIQDMKK
jgi:hypothetical protein